MPGSATCDDLSGREFAVISVCLGFLVLRDIETLEDVFLDLSEWSGIDELHCHVGDLLAFSETRFIH